MQHDHLSSALTEKIEILMVMRDVESGNYSWVLKRRVWANVETDGRRNIFSVTGVGTRGVTMEIRPDYEFTLHHAIRWSGEFLLPTSLVLNRDRDRQLISAAICSPQALTAKPQAKTSRDAMNRPVVEQRAAFDFPGILTELYYRNEADEIRRSTSQRRVLVTPKVIVLRAGDLVQKGAEPPYTVRQVMDLDPYKNEYVIERQDDV